MEYCRNEHVCDFSQYSWCGAAYSSLNRIVLFVFFWLNKHIDPVCVQRKMWVYSLGTLIGCSCRTLQQLIPLISTPSTC